MNDKNASQKYKPVANPALAQAMRELRRSSAASPHDNRPNRQRTRKDVKKVAIRDSMNS